MGWGPKAPKPDTNIGIAAREQMELAQQAQQWYQDLFEKELLPRMDEQWETNKKVSNAMLSDMEKSSAFADEQRNLWRDVYQPLERRSAQEAADYGSTEMVGRRMGIASANVNQAFDQSQSRAVQEMAKYGIRLDPNAFAGMQRRFSTARAAADAGARTGVAMDTIDKGIALRSGAVQTGRGMQSGVAQALATGQNAGAGASGASGSSIGGASQVINTAGQGFNTAIQGYGSAGSMLNQRYATQVQAAGQNPLMELVGTGIGAYAALSSKKVKDRKESLDDEDVLGKIRGLKVDRWAYKGDDKLHIGPYAEDLHAKFGVGDGATIGVMDSGGIALAGLKQLAEKVDRISRRMGIDTEAA